MAIELEVLRMNINFWVFGSPRQHLRELKSKQSDIYSPEVVRLDSRIFFAVMVIVVAVGWYYRDMDYLSAKEGMGYYLGIVGSVMMLLLLLYPLRKNARFMRNWGNVKLWFRMHKALGILGPVLVLYHANFRLHAVNSNVALFAMLLVVMSGLLGRFIYVKIHYSHVGQKLTLQELERLFGISKEEVEHEVSISPRVKDRLNNFERDELSPAKNWLHSLWRIITLGRRSAWMKRSALRDLRIDLNASAKRGELVPAMINRRLAHDRELIHEYLLAVKRVSEFGFYCQVFSWWHFLHIPLFVMLVITGVIHVIAVHMY
jgi:hypothetical protein